MPTGWGHQCRLPWLWWARLRGKRLGATWRCNCGKRWRIGAMNTHGVPGIGLIYEWQEVQDG